MKHALLFFFSFCYSFCIAQNLVPNPSFEDTVMCPNYNGSIIGTKDWYAAEGQNGLEGLRMTPNITINGLNVKEEIYTGIGGDPIANQYYGSSANPTATLEVNS